MSIEKVSPDIRSAFSNDRTSDSVGDDITKLYVQDTKRHPRTSGEEIAALTSVVQQGIEAQALLDDENVHTTYKRRKELEETARQGRAARNEIVVSNTGLVFKWASYYHAGGVEYLDLIQAGNLGLIRAAEKFDPSKGFAFSTYATTWIKSFISEEIHNTKRTIRIQPEVSAQMQKLRTIVESHQLLTGEDMTTKQMADAMKKKEEYVIDLLSWEHETVSLNLNTGINANDDPLFEKYITDIDALPVEEEALDAAYRHNIVSAVRNLIANSTMDDTSKDLIRKQYGIGYDKPFTYRQLVKEFGSGKYYRILNEAKQQLGKEAVERELSGLLDS